MNQNNPSFQSNPNVLPGANAQTPQNIFTLPNFQTNQFVPFQTQPNFHQPFFQAPTSAGAQAYLPIPNMPPMQIQNPQPFFGGQVPHLPSAIVPPMMAPSFYSKEENINRNLEAKSESNLKEKAAPLNYTPRVAGKWIEYKTTNGLRYYYDSVEGKTVWQRPKEFYSLKDNGNENENEENGKEETFKQKESVRNENDGATDKTNQQISPISIAFKTNKNSGEIKKQTSKENKVEKEKDSSSFSTPFSLLSHEECVGMFKALLEEKEVAHDSEWAGILSDIIKDSRYGAIRTLAERKKIFADFCSEKRHKLRKARKAAAEAKMQVLTEVLKNASEVTSETKFSDIEETLLAQERFSSLSYTEKRSVFTKYRDSLRREKRRREGEIYRKNAPLFEDLLEKTPEIAPDSTWEDIKLLLAAEKPYKKLRESDRIKLFRRHRSKIRRKHKEELEKKKELEKEEERMFLELLDSLSMEKTMFHSKSRWRDVMSMPDLVDDKRYICFTKNEKRKEVAHKLFERYCYDMEDKLLDDKNRMKKFLRSKRKRVSFDDQTNDIYDALNEMEDFPNIKENHAKVILLEMIAKARHKKMKRGNAE